jgi:hypothetical protein
VETDPRLVEVAAPEVRGRQIEQRLYAVDERLDGWYVPRRRRPAVVGRVQGRAELLAVRRQGHVEAVVRPAGTGGRSSLRGRASRTPSHTEHAYGPCENVDAVPRSAPFVDRATGALNSGRSWAAFPLVGPTGSFAGLALVPFALVFPFVGNSACGVPLTVVGRPVPAVGT